MKNSTDKYLFSIIIPVYNLEKYISETLDSIIKQNYSNFELIIINDGSTDNTENIIKIKLNNVNFNYKIINQPNKGVSVARNKGIEIAQGKYLYFLDGDDKISNNFLLYLDNIIKKNNADIYFFGIQKFYEDNILFSYIPDGKYCNSILDSKYVLQEYLNFNIYMNMCSFLIKKEVLTKNSIKFTPGIKHGEDREFLIKSFYHSQNAYGINKILFYYKKRDDSADHKEFTIYKIHSPAALKHSLIYLLKNNCHDIEILNLIRNYRLPLLYYAIINEILKSEIYKEDLYPKIVSNKYIKQTLKNFKLLFFNFKNLIYFINIKLILYFPKIYKRLYKMLKQ